MAPMLLGFTVSISLTVINIALAPTCAIAATASKTLRIEDRTPIAFIINSPARTIASATHSDIIRKVSDLLLMHTDFFPENLDGAIVGECRGRLSCLAEKARSEAYPRYILMITSLAIAPERDRITALLLDTQRALALLEAADRNQASWKDDAEVSIGDQAVVVHGPRRDVETHDALMHALELIFDEDLRGPLDKRQHWAPYGQVVVNAPVDGLEVRVDGTSVGTLAKGATQILGVRPGSRKLDVRAPSGDAFEQTVLVTRGATTPIDVPKINAINTREDVSHPSIARPFVFWGGVLFASAGAAVLTSSLLRSKDTVTSCFGCSSTSTFITTKYNDDAYTHGQLANPPGVMLAPLGLAMIVGGGVWSVGTATLGDDADVPWIQIGAGLAAGMLTYGMAAALNGARPESRP